ncbi:MAG: peptide deformylase [Tagaea sp.]|jgi:peptide deformylase|nr:peptide deformylase [Azospirillum sp.]MCA3265096.1 peptide deformylase [Azospirillum sp.]MCZ8125112.1 peptide deformylase [Magnetospirillum sp.]
MALREILVAPDPRLKIKARPVETFDDALRTLLDDMVETMYAAKGIGLAAPQVGVPSRAIVMDLAREGEPPAPRKFVNPEIVWASDEEVPCEEGCLSVPGQYADVTRPERVRVRYRDETGVRHEIDCDGLLAVCIQHEMDHLEGVLFVDHLSALKRNMMLRKVQKAQRQKTGS